VIRGALEREINHEPDKSADHSGANVIINLCVYVLVCVCVRACVCVYTDVETTCSI